MKLLITGGNGMVGKHLQEILPNATYIGSKDCNLTSCKEVEHMMFLNVTFLNFDILKC